MRAEAVEVVLGFGLAAIVAGALTPLWIRHAERQGLLLDRPAPRRVHKRIVPRVGGFALLMGILAGCTPFLVRGDLLPGLRWWIPLAAFFAVGVLDDAFSPRASIKLTLQVAATGIALVAGLRWSGTGFGAFPPIHLGSLAWLGTGLWILIVLQVINFLDGIDLIVFAVAGVILAAAAGAGVGPAGGLLFVAAVGAIAGTSIFNVPPARVFLGDGGSHALAFLVATTALEVEGASGVALPWPVALAMLLPALADIGMGFASKRRLGYAWAAPHREHLYQRLTVGTATHTAVAARYAGLTFAAFLIVTLLGERVGAWWAASAVALLIFLHVVLGRLQTTAVVPAAPRPRDR